MKLVKAFMAMTTIAAMTTSCLNDDSYTSGFSVLQTRSSVIYANNLQDTLYLQSYGPWSMKQNSGGDWCQMGMLTGRANDLYAIPINMTLNTTQKMRPSSFTITDVDHTDTYITIQINQMGTCGSGALGCAAKVRSISGSDGSSMQFDYDNAMRPTKLKMTKDGTTLASLRITYDDRTATMTVNDDIHGVLTSSFGPSFQPQELVGDNDTVSYEVPIHDTYAQVYACTITQTLGHGNYRAHLYKISNYNEHPDSIGNADSLRYVRHLDNVTETEKLALAFSKTSNGYQTIDANQLLLGVEHCNPYLLLSMYRNARNANIISKATNDNPANTITVSTTQNADKSISTMTVERNGKDITYTFNYE